ncbi:hypothetical protein A1O1_05636 [Capronia coronata CBS 617.96]|uniref:Uncharacterized protein n=1 Tax=Capronia coronata CBS 617.96 TaxID=1182541 RepID=W9Z2G2_9EURO|nr:uncharacterized protein A1O1_05636 [Capronia coronata CBS 617.96]EXJ88704.1 hypothetical protein A1O1_05636 [Capronia coronata CBS 617.96]
MSPSLFSNEYSRGPLYQYWKERGEEEKGLRDQRVQEANLRSKGVRPLNPTYGPSSNEQYTSRATSGPPAYRPDDVGSPVPITSDPRYRVGDESFSSTVSSRAPPSEPESLPSYGTATTGLAGSPQQTHPSSTSKYLSLSADEQKTRLHQLEVQRRQQIAAADDAAAQTLSIEEVESDSTSLSEEPVQGRGTADGKQPKRRKSTAGKIGQWLADAACGYTKKQERW